MHLAFAGREGMRLAWFTWNSANSSVRYGTTSGGPYVTSVSTDSAREYLSGWGFHHVIKVHKLKPNTSYYYSVGSSEGGWSQEFSFQTAPEGDFAFSLSAFGDMGYLDSTRRPLELPPVAGLVRHWSAQYSRNQLEILKDTRQIDFVWNLGDVAYADDSYAHKLFSFDYENTYNGYMDWMQNLSSSMPYMVSVGNHESECHSPSCMTSMSTARNLSNFTAYNARWLSPHTKPSPSLIVTQSMPGGICLRRRVVVLKACGPLGTTGTHTSCLSTARQTGMGQKSSSQGTPMTRLYRQGDSDEMGSTLHGSEQIWR